MRARSAALLLAAAALSGCVPWLPEPVAVQLPPPAPDAAEMRLAEAAERAERALARLARTLPAPDTAAAMPALKSVPAALRRPVTLDWTGPVETVAAMLAGRAGYRFLQAGRPPARPLVVSVEADGTPLIAVLRDAALRAGDAATLTVDAAAETVVLDWTTQAQAGAEH